MSFKIAEEPESREKSQRVYTILTFNNKEVSGEPNYERFCFYAYLDSELVGGVMGYTSWGICYLETLSNHYHHPGHNIHSQIAR